MATEADVDALYRLPLAEFTKARNALAKRIGGAEAKSVRALAKPTIVPWAVNQLYWRARPVYDQLLATGRSLREAQIGALEGRRGAADAVRRATDGHRRTLDSALSRVSQLAAAAGERPAADEVRRLLETLSLASSHPEQPGRLTTVVRPAGFEALAGVTPVASQTSPDRGRRQGGVEPAAHPRTSVGADESADRQARRKQEIAVASSRQALDEALAKEAQAKDAVDRASAAYEEARRARRDAEQVLGRLKAEGS